MMTSTVSRILQAALLTVAMACSGAPGRGAASSGGGNGGGATAPGEGAMAADGAEGPGRGESCPEGTCADGLQCLRYQGIAGDRGPTFTSCETPCGGKDAEACPDGLACTVVADGPGAVCR